MTGAAQHPMQSMWVDSPVGRLLLIASADGLVNLAFEGRLMESLAWRGTHDSDGQAARWLHAARQQLAEYFAGARWAFDVPLAPRGTAFQLSVWSALRQIPPGSVMSYGEVARRIHAPRAVRAVGAANGQNPIAIIIPCHRVIGSDGSLVGFGGGLDRKRWLLDHERGQLTLG
jgi:O-6-methylguanine DNA methyltransferase